MLKSDDDDDDDDDDGDDDLYIFVHLSDVCPLILSSDKLGNVSLRLNEGLRILVPKGDTISQRMTLVRNCQAYRTYSLVTDLDI